MRSIGLLTTLLTILPTAWCLSAEKTPWPPAAPLKWTCGYDADVPPEKAYPYWSGGQRPDTERSIDGGVLRIVDNGTKKGALHCYSQRWGIEPERGAVIEARVKLIRNDSRSGACFMGADGNHELGFTLYPDRIEGGGTQHAMTTTDDFHVYRLAFREKDYVLWVDGKLVINGQGKNTHPAHSGRNIVMFGSVSSKAKSEALWDYVRYAALDRTPPPPRIAGATDVVIYKKEDIYACFPSLIHSKDDTLFTSFGTRVRRSHIDGTGGSAQYVSKDRGKTWQPCKGDRPVDPRMRCKDGSLAYARAQGWRQVPASRREEFEKKGIVVRDVKPGVVAYLQGAVAGRSTDGGKTWTRQAIDVPPHRSLMNFNLSERCQLKSGVLLNAAYGQLKDDKIGRAFLLRSEDCGKTWRLLPLAADPKGKVRLNETALVENDRGEVIAMIRSEPAAGGHLYHTISADQGKTWSAAKRTKIWGYPANLLLLKDGRILCTYGYRRHPQGVRAVLSNDGGHTWDLDNILVIRNDHYGPGGDLGYPISIEIAPGEIFTVYYITLRDGITHIAGTTWEVPKQ